MTNIQMEALDFKYLLLEYYKKLRLTENELSVLLMIDHLLNQKNTLITPDLLCMKMNLSSDELDKIFVSLIERGFLLFDVATNIKVSIKPLHKKLYELFEQDLASENERKFNETKSKNLDELKKEFKKELGRELSPLEVTLITEWLNKGFDKDRISDALKECVSRGNKTLKDVDELLFKWLKRDDFNKAGFSNTDDKWDKDIEKTMEIAKAKWIDD